MKETTTYKGYIASFHYSVVDEIFYGKVEHINDSITFESNTEEGLQKEFEKTINDYIKLCNENNIIPK